MMELSLMFVFVLGIVLLALVAYSLIDRYFGWGLLLFGVALTLACVWVYMLPWAIRVGVSA